MSAVDDVAQGGLGGELHGRVGQAHALGAGADLLDGLLAGDVGAGRPAQRRLGADLQQQGRLADPRIAGQQDGRAGHDAAAADPVELVHAGDDARRGGRVGLQALEGQAPRLGPARGGQGARRTRDDLLGQAVPRPARRALAGPLGMDRAAGLAGVDGAVAGHGAPILVTAMLIPPRPGFPPQGAVSPPDFLYFLGVYGVGRPKAAARVQGILLRPRAEWDVIDTEPATTQGLFTGYACILAAIPAVAMILSHLLFIHWTIVPIIVIAVLSYVASLLGVFIVGFIIDALAPSFDGQKNQVQAMKLAVYSYTAAWVAGILNIVPLLGILAIIAALYGLYILYLGLPKLMKSPPEKTPAISSSP